MKSYFILERYPHCLLYWDPAYKAFLPIQFMKPEEVKILEDLKKVFADLKGKLDEVPNEFVENKKESPITEKADKEKTELKEGQVEEKPKEEKNKEENVYNKQ